MRAVEQVVRAGEHKPLAFVDGHVLVVVVEMNGPFKLTGVPVLLLSFADSSNNLSGKFMDLGRDPVRLLQHGNLSASLQKRFNVCSCPGVNTVMGQDAICKIVVVFIHF